LIFLVPSAKQTPHSSLPSFLRVSAQMSFLTTPNRNPNPIRWSFSSPNPLPLHTIHLLITCLHREQGTRAAYCSGPGIEHRGLLCCRR
jgi:hypothetical protein